MKIVQKVLIFGSSCILALLFYTCAAVQAKKTRAATVAAADKSADRSVRQASAGLTQAQDLVEAATPASLKACISIIEGNRGLKSSETGRMLETVAAALLRSVYPESDANIPALNPPSINTYAQILQNTAKGIYKAPPEGTRDYLQLTLPFLACLGKNQAAQKTSVYQEALPSL
jgi:hypothetical protein